VDEESDGAENSRKLARKDFAGENGANGERKTTRISERRMRKRYIGDLDVHCAKAGNREAGRKMKKVQGRVSRGNASKKDPFFIGRVIRGRFGADAHAPYDTDGGPNHNGEERGRKRG